MFSDETDNMREYVRGVWDDWFDIVFPPTQPGSVMDPDDDLLSLSETKRYAKMCCL